MPAQAMRRKASSSVRAREWTASAERLEAAAREAEAAGRRVSARGLFLRASSYFPSSRTRPRRTPSTRGWAERLSRSTRATLHFRGEPYGVPGDSRFDLYREVLKYRLGDEVADITTPR
jgi:hypothetical protein